MIDRKFKVVKLEEVNEEHHNLYSLLDSSYGNISWNDLLKSKRVLIVSEAGSGKTHECKVQNKKLWEEGQTSFFIELAELSRSKLEDLLDCDEEERLILDRPQIMAKNLKSLRPHMLLFSCQTINSGPD